jgi:hypothetical protein
VVELGKLLSHVAEHRKSHLAPASADDVDIMPRSRARINGEWTRISGEERCAISETGTGFAYANLSEILLPLVLLGSSG